MDDYIDGSVYRVLVKGFGESSEVVVCRNSRRHTISREAQDDDREKKLRRAQRKHEVDRHFSRCAFNFEV